MGNKKILVVDDEQDLCEILQFNLESEGFIVETAYSAERALKILTGGYDLILLDVMMEGMSGFKMAEKMRKDMKLNIPVIFLTAKDTENDMLTGFSIGADDYIPKPFSIKEVIARVKAVLKRTNSSSEVPILLEIGNVVMNLESKKTMVDGEEIILTKKEFEILAMLLKFPDRVFSREDFLNRIWTNEEYVLERTVDVHITRLRKKLKEADVKIVNRPGYGYCLGK